MTHSMAELATSSRLLESSCRQTRFGYDLAYNLYETSTTIEDGDVVSARFGYDAANHLTATTEPGTAGTTTMTYSPTGRLETVRDADGATWSYEYSMRGELTGAIAPDGTKSESTYDPAGRVLRTGNESDGYSTFEYDPAGRLTRSRDPQGAETTYSYDDSGRPAGVIDTTRGSSHPVEFQSTLSPGGRRESESRTYYGLGPESGDTDLAAVSYSYGTDGTLEHITSPQLIGTGDISRTADPSTGWAYSTSSPATRVVYGYDSAGRASDLTTTAGVGPGAATIASPTTYDVAGNVVTQGAWAYQYDKLGRLIRAEDSSSGEVLEYKYDLASNRTEVKRGGNTTQSLSFGPANEIDTTTDPQFAYDSAGRLMAKRT